MEHEITTAKFLTLTPEKQNEAWYDWFCKDTSLPGKTVTLVRKLKQIAFSPKFDLAKTYIFFKNNCPMYGDFKLYDDFRICDIETGDVLFTVTPRDPYGKAEVWGKENEFKEAIVSGTWKDVLTFFNGG